MCKHFFCHLSLPERWRFLAMRVRCALHPDRPEAIEQLFRMGGLLYEHGDIDAWQLAHQTATVLVDTAADSALPWHWRCQCLDHVARPLGVMRHISDMQQLPPHEATECRRVLQALSQRLACLELHRAP